MAAREGQKKVTDFFKPPPTRGRPKGSTAKRRGRRPAAPKTSKENQQEQVQQVVPKPTAPKEKQKRTNWGVGENAENMAKAVREWDSKTGRCAWPGAARRAPPREDPGEDPSPHDLTCRELINDAGGDGATLKLAKRKLDALGNFKPISFLANAPERIHRLQQAATLAASMSEIKRADADEKKRKKVAASTDLVALAPAALKKLAAKGNDVSKITVAEIRSILLVCYKTQAPESIKKAKAVETLTKAIDADAAPLTQTIVAAPVAEVARLPRPQPPTLRTTTLQRRRLVNTMSERSSGGRSRGGRYLKPDTARRHFIFHIAFENLQRGVLPTPHDFEPRARAHAPREVLQRGAPRLDARARARAPPAATPDFGNFEGVALKKMFLRKTVASKPSTNRATGEDFWQHGPDYIKWLAGDEFDWQFPKHTLMYLELKASIGRPLSLQRSMWLLPDLRRAAAAFDEYMKDAPSLGAPSSSPRRRAAHLALAEATAGARPRRAGLRRARPGRAGLRRAGLRRARVELDLARRFQALGFQALGFQALDQALDLDVLGFDALDVDVPGFDALGFDALALGFQALDFQALDLDVLGFDALDVDVPGFDALGFDALASSSTSARAASGRSASRRSASRRSTSRRSTSTCWASTRSTSTCRASTLGFDALASSSTSRARFRALGFGAGFRR
ncbi:hypothetical protein JL722_14324 [Aureococcus anophagefferens]|nr:hypothetical protein JL722_14324 [Aureococcus anophagefferens]